MPAKKSVNKVSVQKQPLLVVKRRGQMQAFDERKVYGSIYSACASCHLKEKECEKLADQVLAEVKKAISNKKQINSTELFGLVIAILAKYHEDAAFMYQVHRDIS